MKTENRERIASGVEGAGTGGKTSASIVLQNIAVFVCLRLFVSVWLLGVGSVADSVIAVAISARMTEWGSE